MRGTWLAVFWVTVAVAEENPSPGGTQAAPATPVSPDGSIATAKREFNALKSGRSSWLEKGEPPQVRAPELTISPTQSTDSPIVKLPGGKTPSSKTANWLVDAMIKPKTDTGDLPGKDRARMQSKSPSTVAKDGENVADRMEEAARDSAPEHSTKIQSAPPSPLSSYMAGWMSPADFTLLRSVAEADVTIASAGSGLETGRVERFESNELRLSIEGFSMNRNPTVTTIGTRGPDVENPYMKEFETLKGAPSPAIATISPASDLSAPPAMDTGPAVKTAGPVSPGQPIAVPDFARRSDDAKYFPQLKRF